MKRAFTLVEIMIALVIAIAVLSLGVNMFLNRRTQNILYLTSRTLESEVLNARNEALNLSCPLRLIPCTDSRCRPPGAGAEFRGYAVQVYCKPAATTSQYVGLRSTCNTACEPGTSDGYDEWDFFRQPVMIDPGVQFFGGALIQQPLQSDGITAGLVFPNSARTPVLSSGAALLPSQIDPTLGVVAVIGLLSRSPYSSADNAGFAIWLRGGGIAGTHRCANQQC